MKRNFLLFLSMALTIASPGVWSARAHIQNTRSEHKERPASDGARSESRQCDGGPPVISFPQAREAFVRRGLLIRGEGKVNVPEDLIGGIMILTPFRSWLYVTKVELRYDSNASELAYALLEGYLPDGRTVREDTRQKLPASFRPVRALAEIGPMLFDLSGNRRTVRGVRYTISKLGLTLVSQQCDWCQTTEDPGGSGGGPSPCQMVASGNCNAIFCTQTCKAVVNDPCDCSGFGFCYSIPGGSCQGTCPDESLPNCHIVSNNPGDFHCDCIAQ